MKISSYTVVFDACVLYPAPLRDLLIELAASGLFRAKWTDRIQQEWVRTLLKNRPDIDPKALDRTKQLMEAAVSDCLVMGYEDIEKSLSLPDSDDNHVLAAAIKSKSSGIITTNLKHFPKDELDKYDVEAQHPDEFIHHQFGLNAASVIIAVQRCRGRLRKPPMSADEYLACLEGQGLPLTVDMLWPYSAMIQTPLFLWERPRLRGNELSDGHSRA